MSSEHKNVFFFILFYWIKRNAGTLLKHFILYTYTHRRDRENIILFTEKLKHFHKRVACDHIFINVLAQEFSLVALKILVRICVSYPSTTLNHNMHMCNLARRRRKKQTWRKYHIKSYENINFFNAFLVLSNLFFFFHYFVLYLSFVCFGMMHLWMIRFRKGIDEAREKFCFLHFLCRSDRMHMGAKCLISCHVRNSSLQFAKIH